MRYQLRQRLACRQCQEHVEEVLAPVPAAEEHLDPVEDEEIPVAFEEEEEVPVPVPAVVPVVPLRRSARIAAQKKDAGAAAEKQSKKKGTGTAGKKQKKKKGTGTAARKQKKDTTGLVLVKVGGVQVRRSARNLKQKTQKT